MPEILKIPYQWQSYLRRDRLRILMFHSILEHTQDQFAVSPKLFLNGFGPLVPFCRPGVGLPWRVKDFCDRLI